MKKLISLLLIITTVTLSLFALSGCAGVGKGASTHYGVRPMDGKLRFAELKVKGYGSIILLLEEDTAPITVNNFLSLAESGFYDGLTFHRVMENFMIQGGDPDADGTGGSETTIKGEFALNGFSNNLSHLYGTISMARSDDMNSASSQFFICNADATSLNGSYAAFGYVIAGMSIVENITKDTVEYANSSSGVISNKSNQAVIKSIREISKDEALKKAK